MVDNGFYLRGPGDEDRAVGIGIENTLLTLSADNQHFVDEVRRQLIEEYGEEKIKPLDIPFGQHWMYSDNRKQSALRNDSKPWISCRKYGQVLQRLKLKEMSTYRRVQALKGKPPSFGSRFKDLSSK